MAAALSFGTFMNFGEKSSNNSDSWQDANSALAELDKGNVTGIISVVACLVGAWKMTALVYFLLFSDIFTFPSIFPLRLGWACSNILS